MALTDQRAAGSVGELRRALERIGRLITVEIDELAPADTAAAPARETLTPSGRAPDECYVLDANAATAGSAFRGRVRAVLEHADRPPVLVVVGDGRPGWTAQRITDRVGGPAAGWVCHTLPPAR